MSDKVKALRVLATGLYSDGSETEAQSVEAIALYVENLESSLAALKEENERLKARVAELEEHEKIYIEVLRVADVALKTVRRKEPANEG